MKYSFLFLIIFISHTFLFSQHNQLNFHQLTTKQGLSESTNHFLYTDSNQFTWIGSQDGANLFDGKEVTAFKSGAKNFRTIKGESTQSSFFEDSFGNIWFTTGEAINCYQRSTDSIIYDFAIRDQDSLLGTPHYAFHMEAGKHLWGVANNRLFRYNVQNSQLNKTQLLGKSIIARAVVDTFENGKVKTIYGCPWANGDGIEIIKIRNDTVYEQKLLFNEPGNSENFTLNARQVIAGIDSGAYFLTDKGLLYLNPDSLENYKFKSFPPHFKAVTHFVKINRRLWLVNGTSEIAQFDLDSFKIIESKIHTYNLDEQKEINNISRIFLGKDSVLWLSVQGKGVFYANMKNQDTRSIFYQNKVSSQRIITLFEIPNGLIGTVSEEGLILFFDKNKNLKSTQQVSKYFKPIRLPNQEIWAISKNEIGEQKKDKQFKWHSLPKEYKRIFDAIAFNDSILLLGTNAGLVNYNIRSHKLQVLASEFVVKLFYDSISNQLWTANASSQLIIWSINDTGDSIKINSLPTISGLGLIHDIKLDTMRQITWVATSKGLVKIINNETDLEKTIITEADGLPNQFIQTVLLDKHQHIWLSTNRGIIRYIPEEKDKEKRFKNFTLRDGLSANDYVSGAGIVSSSGALWFGSNKGVDVIDPDFKTIGTAPKLALKALKIHNQEWRGDSSIYFKKEIILSYLENSLTFEMAALEYTDPLRNRFKVSLLHGNRIDSKLIEQGNSVTYNYLPPGNYQFQFTACNAEGIWQLNKDKMYEIAIKITPHTTKPGGFEH